MSNIGVKITLAFVAGAALGGVGGYFVGRKFEEKESIRYGEDLKRYYEDLIEETKKKYEEVKEGIDAGKKTEAVEEPFQGIPIDPIDRIIDANNVFVDYTSLVDEYSGDVETTESDKDIKEKTGDSKPVRDNVEREEQKSEKKKKSRHKLPVESIFEEEFQELANDDGYKLKQYYLDGDVWTRVFSDDYREDIPVDDFPIPLSDFRWSKNGIAYFVNHDEKQLYKFYNEGTYN